MNDIDMWNDIEELEEMGLKKEAEELHLKYIKKYVEE